MEKRNDQLEEMIIEMQAKMIQKLTFFGNQCSCGKDNCECKK